MKKYSFFYNLLRAAKNNLVFEVYDCHVHPADVMGAVIEERSFTHNESVRDFEKKSLAEFMKYGRPYIFLARTITALSPKTSKKFIQKYYANDQNIDSLLAMMQGACVDKAILIPGETAVSLHKIYERFKSPSFEFFGSIDINSENIQSDLETQLRKYKIIGLKLHPNLQQFHPLPENNPEPLASRLDAIYNFCKKNSLCLLIHTGRTNFLSSGMKQYSMLTNFFYGPRESLFDRYRLKVILGHLGSYAMMKLDIINIKRLLASESGNIYFDTAGMSPGYIKRYIQQMGVRQLIFGSDAMYNSMYFSVGFLVEAVYQTSIRSNVENNLKIVFSDNIRRAVGL